MDRKWTRAIRALTRTALVVAVAGTVAAIAAAAPVLASPADQSGAYQVDSAHDGYIADAGLTAPLTQAWSITLPATVSYPLIVNGMVFVTTSTTLYALNQATGSTVWSHSVGAGPGLTYDRGRVFVLTSGGLLTAFDPVSGSIDWSKQLSGQWSFTSAPTAANGIVYTGGAGSGGTVYAVSESDGHVLWSQPVMNGDDSSPAVDAQGVYVSYACQQAYAFDPLAGSLLWHHDSVCEGGGGQTPVVADGTVFARDGVLGNVMLSASDGSELGAFNAGPPPAVANSVAFMLYGSTLTAIANAGQGTNSWTFTGDSHLDSAPLVAGGLVFVGSSQGNLYALDAATGATSWSTDVGSAVSDGLGAANGTLIVPAGDQLSAYRTAGSITDPPANSSPPTIDGTADAGELLAADVGIWSGLPSSYAYQWELCDGAGLNCADIGGATDFTYTPTAGDVGSTLRVKVTATNGNGSSSPVESAASSVVGGGGGGVPVSQTPPTISGTAQQDELLTADPGTWSGSPTSYSYQWRRCDPANPSSCSDISGETGSSYFVSPDDVGYRLVVRVVATNAGGDSAPADSAPTDVVVSGAGAPENLSPPTISGDAHEGAMLSADPGEWSGSPTTYSYQWFSCDVDFIDCPNITGATDPTYVVGPADLDRYIGVEIVASNANGDSFPADSDVVGPVVAGLPVNLTPPAITGTAQAGRTLTLSIGTWSGDPTSFKYQWYSCDNPLDSCTAIPAATGTSYQVSPGDLGRRLIAGVVATNMGGDSAEERSNATDPVVPAVPGNQVPPTISGTAKQGATLTADPGAWTNSPTGYAYQWERCDSAGTGCASIDGATTSTYQAVGADVGTRLVVTVVAVNAGGRSASSGSNPTGLVAGPDCHVPKVVGLKLAAAKTRIRAHQCRVGRITRKASSRTKKGRVVSQSPGPGKRLANGARVSLRVGKGRA